MTTWRSVPGEGKAHLSQKKINHPHYTHTPPPRSPPMLPTRSEKMKPHPKHTRPDTRVQLTHMHEPAQSFCARSPLERIHLFNPQSGRVRSQAAASLLHSGLRPLCSRWPHFFTRACDRSKAAAGLTAPAQYLMMMTRLQPQLSHHPRASRPQP